MTDQLDEIVPPATKASRRRRRRRRIALLTAATVLVAGAAWVATVVHHSCGSLYSGVYRVDGECVGVTDGSYVFHPVLADGERMIAKENARVRAASSSYVTVALLDPFTPTAMKALPAEAVRNRLEGAYPALRRVNSTRVVGDLDPQIRLVLASEGTGEQWRRVLGQLVDMSRRPANPLVAVIGLGVSTEQTKRRAEELAEHGIPMVGALLTAEKLNYDKIKGFGSLEHRSCMHRTLSILTAGTDLGAILEEREQELREANLTIVFAGTVDAEGRGRNVPGTPEHYDDFLSAFQQQGFSAGQLGDGGAIMMHDALLTATKTVRLAAPRGAASSPTADDVRGQLLNLNGNFEVPGAGGGMSFSADSPGAGNPQDSPDCRLTETGEAIGKPMPVLQYPQSAGDSSRQVGPLYCVPT